MKARRILIAAAIATVAALGGLASTAKGDPAGNAVAEWSVIASNTLVAFPAPAGGAAPALQINMGMTQGAVYDARQRNHAEASPAVPAQAAFLRAGEQGRSDRGRGLPRPQEHRRDGAGWHPVPE